MIRFFGAATASLLMLSSPLAVAQTGGGVLSKTIGTVLIDGAATAGGPVAAGSIVMTGAASSATIVYPDGCVVNVAAKSSVTVGSLSPLRTGRQRRDRAARLYSDNHRRCRGHRRGCGGHCQPEQQQFHQPLKLPPRWAGAGTTGQPLPVYCIVVSLCGLVLGGATQPGFAGDVILQVLATPLLVLGATQALAGGPARLPRTEFLLLVAIALIPLAQTIPLPPALWTALPQASLRMAAFQLTGQEPDWQPLSLTPEATALAALALIAPFAVYLSARQLDFRQRRWLVLAVLAVAGASVFLGLAQIAGGPQSSLRFYSNTNTLDAVGFFANRNHFAALLYVAVLLAAPFALDGGIGFLHSRRGRQTGEAHLAGFAGGAALMFLLGVSQIMARSRAGAGLTLVAAICVAWMMLADPRNHWRRASLVLLAVSMVTVILFAAQFGVSRFVERLTFDPQNDTRLVIARHTFAAAWRFMPFGTGLGSFQNIYSMLEKPGDIYPYVYINAAHDDWLQIALEAGLPGVLALAAFVIWLVWRGWQLCWGPGMAMEPLDRLLQRGALIAAGLLLLHSLADYPLRPSAGMMLLAICCALICPPLQVRRTI